MRLVALTLRHPILGVESEIDFEGLIYIQHTASASARRWERSGELTSRSKASTPTTNELSSLKSSLHVSQRSDPCIQNCTSLISTEEVESVEVWGEMDCLCSFGVGR